MKPKKHNNKNLENKKSTFFLFGLALTLMVILCAFEAKQVENEHKTGLANQNFDIEEIEITVQPEPPKPDPPKLMPQKIEEVPDGEESSEDLFQTLENNGNISPVFAFIPIPPETNKEEAELILHGTEIMPQFIGGDKALFDYLQSNLIYPREALEHNIQGTVHVRFVIEKDGSISNVSIARGSHPLLENEAIRVIRNMPSWNPGTQIGRPVRVWQTLPVRFLLK